jgi:hypothetical protein
MGIHRTGFARFPRFSQGSLRRDGEYTLACDRDSARPAPSSGEGQPYMGGPCAPQIRFTESLHVKFSADRN